MKRILCAGIAMLAFSASADYIARHGLLPMSDLVPAPEA